MWKSLTECPRTETDQSESAWRFRFDKDVRFCEQGQQSFPTGSVIEIQNQSKLIRISRCKVETPSILERWHPTRARSRWRLDANDLSTQIRQEPTGQFALLIREIQHTEPSEWALIVFALCFCHERHQSPSTPQIRVYPAG
jgi:hypothetical protein